MYLHVCVLIHFGLYRMPQGQSIIFYSKFGKNQNIELHIYNEVKKKNFLLKRKECTFY